VTQGTEHDEAPSDEDVQLESEPQADHVAEQPADRDVVADASGTPDEADSDADPLAPDDAVVEEPAGGAAEEPEFELEELEVDAEEPEVAHADDADSSEPADPDSAEPADPEADDLEAAIAEAGANLEAEETFDDIAPGTVAPTQGGEPAAAEVAPGVDSVSIWPFVVYDLVWLAYAGVLIWQFEKLPAGQAVFESPLYQSAVFAGVALTIAGPLLILATWIGSWGRPGASKWGLFVSALIQGAIATALGVTLWWVALMVLDQLRLGRLL